MPIDYIGIAAAIGIYIYVLLWFGRLLKGLTRPDED